MNDGKFWAGLTAAKGMTAVTVPVVKAMAAFFADTRFQSYLENALKLGIVGTVSMVGTWEFGAELWDDAIQLLEDPADNARAKVLMKMGPGALRGLLGSGEPQDQQDRRILGLVLNNMMSIAFLNPDLMTECFNNTWRKRLMKGEFMSYLSAMIAGGAIGSAVPMFGTLIGLIFGVTAMAVLPRERVHELTFALQDIRRTTLGVGLSLNNSRLEQKSQLPPAEFMKSVIQRRSSRSAFVTILFEQMHEVFKNAQGGDRPVNIDQVKLLITDALARTRRFYADEKNRFAQAGQKLNPQTPAANRAALSEELRRMEQLELFFTSFSSQLFSRVETIASAEDPETLSSSDQALLRFIEKNYAHGYDEDQLVGLWNQQLKLAGSF
jgi:hypothetical protein